MMLVACLPLLDCRTNSMRPTPFINIQNLHPQGSRSSLQVIKYSHLSTQKKKTNNGSLYSVVPSPPASSEKQNETKRTSKTTHRFFQPFAPGCQPQALKPGNAKPVGKELVAMCMHSVFEIAESQGTCHMNQHDLGASLKSPALLVSNRTLQTSSHQQEICWSNHTCANEQHLPKYSWFCPYLPCHQFGRQLFDCGCVFSVEAHANCLTVAVFFRSKHPLLSPTLYVGISQSSGNQNSQAVF